MRAHADHLCLSLSLSLSLALSFSRSLSLSLALSPVLGSIERGKGKRRGEKMGKNLWRRARIIFLKELESSGLSGMLILSFFLEKLLTVSALV
jgi:formate hydrogenlyase subunit 3/multisubunit Na+/H+ antiporter MnhD subunit